MLKTRSRQAKSRGTGLPAIAAFASSRALRDISSMTSTRIPRRLTSKLSTKRTRPLVTQLLDAGCLEDQPPWRAPTPSQPAGYSRPPEGRRPSDESWNGESLSCSTARGRVFKNRDEHRRRKRGRASLRPVAAKKVGLLAKRSKSSSA